MQAGELVRGIMLAFIYHQLGGNANRRVGANSENLYYQSPILIEESE